MTIDRMVNFLPSYVGSKKRWVENLSEFRGDKLVEPFCGSAVLSSNLASKCILNDKDKYIYNILSRFDELIVPDVFTRDDYFSVRTQSDWWKYAFCLQRMSFSGVFRHSKNGYNVPIKAGIESVSLKKTYEAALVRWRNLKPIVTNGDYQSVLSRNLKGHVIILDPPYEGSQASYNNTSWNPAEYERFITECKKAKPKALIVFDRAFNLKKMDILINSTQNMRVNGKYDGDEEAMAIWRDGDWIGNKQGVLFETV